MGKRSPEGLIKARDWTKQYLRNKPPEYHMFTRAKDRAKKSNLEFNIEIKDIVIPDLCPYLNIPLFVGRGRQTDNSPSLDRIDSTKGYIKGNIQVISNKANAMKYSATLEELVKFARSVLEMHDLLDD